MTHAPPSAPFAPLRGIVVLERAGELSVAACAHLLARLGARVVRLEAPDEPQRLANANGAERRLRILDKARVPVSPAHAVAAWQAQLAAADVVLLAPPARDAPEHPVLAPLLSERPAGPVVCVFSLGGLAHDDTAPLASDALAQALGGLMAVTGARDGPPEFARVPVAQMSAAVIGVTAILGALLRRRRDGAGACIDLALIEIVADQLRTHIGLVVRGQTHGFRVGCEHPLCAPWNAYRARDGWLLVCSSGDAHWRALATLMGRPELASDARFATMRARHEHGGEIDALLQAWVGERERAAAIDALQAADVPAGPALQPNAVPFDPVLREAGTIAPDPLSGEARPGMPWRFQPSVTSTAPAPRPRESAGAAGMPLAGVRVLELSRYAAGPLAGFMAASLGAEVIKIEPPEGEECRAWSPQFGGVSGYFANHNAGKRSVTADLRSREGQRIVAHLLADADVLLHNVRPGAMQRLGLDAETVCGAHPRLVYCAISGFGPSGPRLPALDTVIQARLGLTALVGDGKIPLRVGYSIADQLAGHFAAAGIVAALHARSRSGLGGVLDVAMTDALAWLTHPAWHDHRPALPSTQRVPASDGWVVAAATQAQVQEACPMPRTLAREALVGQLERNGIAAAPVLEVDEVLRHATLQRRRALCAVQSGEDASVPVFAAPLGFETVRPARIAALGEDSPEWNSR